ncbi:MAG: DUF72 domain-containing protein [Pseudomonadota bacterium]
MSILTGTSGFSYKPWIGPFYPAGTQPQDMLEFYASRLKAVEINNTFYRMPKRSVLAGWKAQVPDHFRFSLKASRRITHFKRLKGVGEELHYLYQSLAELEHTLGAVLYQLPPNMKRDTGRLEEFLDRLPEGRAAMEFRHASWQDDSVYRLLKARNVALCITDDDEDGSSPFVSTADWGYLRLRRSAYDDAALDQWRERVADQDWSETLAFFKHEDEGAGPRLAARFAQS